MNSLSVSLFWVAAVLIIYTYLGYPAWIYLRSRYRPHPWQQASTLPSVSVILAVHNCASVLEQKINQLKALDYSAERIEFIVVSDGSNDDTQRILAQSTVVKPIICIERRGKAAALNAGMQNAAGEILLFLDIRPRLTSTSLRMLLSNFADPQVGCASGQVVLREDGHDPVTKAVGSLYWRYEQWIRICESKVDSLVGVYGGFYAVRRNLACRLPEATVLDDMLQPLSVIRQGYRSVLDARAIVYDVWPTSARNEFKRKVRTLAGNFQLVTLAPWLLSRDNRVRFEFISHKLLRLLVPALLLVLLICSANLAIRYPLYAIALVAQLVLYMFAAVGASHGLPLISRIAGPARAFCVMNLAVVVGLYRFLFTRGPLWTIWVPTAPPRTASAIDDNPADPTPGN